MNMTKELRIERIKAAIKDRAMKVPEIAEATGISQPYVHDLIDLLRADHLVYIERWAVAGLSRRHTAFYRLGNRKDARKPPTQSKEVRKKKLRVYRARQVSKKVDKADTEYRERVRKELERPAFRDPLVAALFGEYGG